MYYTNNNVRSELINCHNSSGWLSNFQKMGLYLYGTIIIFECAVCSDFEFSTNWYAFRQAATTWASTTLKNDE